MTDAAAAPGSTPAPDAAGAPGAGAGAPAGSPSPAAAPAANGGDTGAPWYQALTQDGAVRQALHSGGFKNFEEFGKSYLETKSLVGRKGVIVPGADATPEQRAAALAQFGRPEKPDGYAFKYPDGYTPTESDKAYETEMRQALFDAGVPAFAVEKIADKHMAYVAKVTGEATKALADYEAAGKQEIAALEKQWGGDAAKNRALAQRAAATILPPDSPLYAKLDSLMGSGPFVDLMYRVGTMISESGGALKAGGDPGRFGPLTKEAASAKIAEVRDAATRDPKHAYVNQQHPEHAAMQKQMMEWYQIAYPGMVQE